MMPTAEEVRDHLARLRRGHALLREATLLALRDLTLEEARAQYDDLVRGWESQRVDLGPVVTRRRLDDRIALRRRIAGGR
jgi:hypothetical protein